jgi:hypothetical protein
VPEEVRFGEMTVGRDQDLAFNLVNMGGAKMSVERLRLAGANRSDFKIKEDGCSGRALLPGAACKIRLGFTPSAPGPRRARLEVQHEASGAMLLVPFSGIGRL